MNLGWVWEGSGGVLGCLGGVWKGVWKAPQTHHIYPDPQRPHQMPTRPLSDPPKAPLRTLLYIPQNLPRSPQTPPIPLPDTSLTPPRHLQDTPDNPHPPRPPQTPPRQARPLVQPSQLWPQNTSFPTFLPIIFLHCLGITVKPQGARSCPVYQIKHEALGIMPGKIN